MKKIVNLFPVVMLESYIDDYNSINQQLMKEINLLFQGTSSKRVLSYKWHDFVITDALDSLGYTTFNDNNLIENQKFSFFYNNIKILINDFFHQLNYKDNWKFVNSWASVYPKGAFIPLHDHKPFHWSGAYYVNAPKDCGDIYFVDPKEYALQNEPKNTLYRGSFNHRITPVSGMLLLFPSYLKHESLPNQVNEDRVIISFNILCE